MALQPYRLDWDDYFMGTAFLAGKRSKNPVTKVGACIVAPDTKVIVGVGYNGFPRGCNDAEYVWNENAHLYEVHAEVNAILNRSAADLKDCTIYVSRFPCNKCTQMIIQSGIKYVVYMHDDNDAPVVEVTAARRMFGSSGIIPRQLVPRNMEININFAQINQNNNLRQILG